MLARTFVFLLAGIDRFIFRCRWRWWCERIQVVAWKLTQSRMEQEEGGMNSQEKQKALEMLTERIGSVGREAGIPEEEMDAFVVRALWAIAEKLEEDLQKQNKNET